jgi:hypothetical protein
MFFQEIVIKNKLNNSWKQLYEESKLTISSIALDKNQYVEAIIKSFIASLNYGDV